MLRQSRFGFLRIFGFIKHWIIVQCNSRNLIGLPAWYTSHYAHAISKKASFLMHPKKCFCSQVIFIVTILDIAIYSFYLFPCRTDIRQFAISFQGPKLFNSFNSEIQNAESISLFKSKLRSFLLNRLLLF